MTFYADEIDKYLKEAIKGIPSKIKECINKSIYSTLGMTDRHFGEWEIKSDSILYKWTSEYARGIVQDFCAKHKPDLSIKDFDKIKDRILNNMTHSMEYEIEKLVSEYIRQMLGPAIQKAVEEKTKAVIKLVEANMNKALGINDLANPEFGSKAIEDLILKAMENNPASLELLKKLKKNA